MVKNIAEFERASASYDIPKKLRDAIDYHADLIILAIGENVPPLKTPEQSSAFLDSVSKLLTALQAQGHPKLIVRSCFWANAAKDDALKAASIQAGGVFVDISTLGRDESNFARSERPIPNAGVANHPGDQGMAAIAAAISKAVREQDESRASDPTPQR